MEFYKTNADNQDAKGAIAAVFMTIIVAPLVMFTLNDMRGYNFSIAEVIATTLGVCIGEAILLIIALKATNKKAVVDGEYIKYFTKTPWGYIQTKSIEISNIAYFLERGTNGKMADNSLKALSLFVPKLGGMGNLKNDDIYYIIDNCNKRRGIVDCKLNTSDYYKNQDNIPLIKYLIENYSFEVKPEPKKFPVMEFLIKTIIGFILALGFMAGFITLMTKI